jgi:ABC-type uncharacterized transport system substrate-binding protein
VVSFNRPDGNVTGISFMTVELGAKQLGLLRELVPMAARIAVLVDPNFPITEPHQRWWADRVEVRRAFLLKTLN